MCLHSMPHGCGAHFVLEEVHFGEDVEVRQLERDHGGERLEAAGDELGRVGDKVAVEAEDGADIPAVVLHKVHEGAQHRDVREELDLAGAVHEEVVVLSEALHSSVLSVGSSRNCALFIRR